MDTRRWEEMETDCLINIFRRLGVDDLAVGVPFVCRSWYRASLSPLCWRVVDFRALDFMPRSNLTKRFIAAYSPPRFSFGGFMRFVVGRSSGAVVDLRFPKQFGTTLKELEFASRECLRLKVLVIPKLMQEVEVHIPELVEKWKDLEQLEIESKPCCFTDMVAQIRLTCKNFGALKMQGAIKEEDSTALIKFLPKLKCLDLDKSYLPKDQLLVIINGCKELESLSVRHCLGFEADEEILRRASGIKTFQHQGSKLKDDTWYDTDDDDVQVIF